MTLRAILRNLVALALGCAAAAALAELFLSIFFPQATAHHLLADRPAMYRDSDYLPWELIPGFDGRHREIEFDIQIRTNSRGYRNREFSPDKGDQSRILIVGDSYTFGHGVEEEQAYPRVAEQALVEGLRGRPLEVINAGYAGARHPETYYLYLKNRGLALDPDLVLIGFYVGNDIDGADARHHEWVRVDEAGLPLVVRSTDAHVEEGRWVTFQRSLRWRLPLIRNSHLAQLLFSAVYAARSVGRKEITESEAWVYRRVYSEETRSMVERVQHLFAAMAKLCAAESAGFAIVVIPTREQIHPEAFPVPEGLDLDKPQRIFFEFFEDEGIPFLDLRPALHRAGPKDLLYFRTDPHWTATGHEIAGRAVADYIVARKLLPPTSSGGAGIPASASERR